MPSLLSLYLHTYLHSKNEVYVFIDELGHAVKVEANKNCPFLNYDIWTSKEVRFALDIYDMIWIHSNTNPL